ncbi:hypothetical protein, partial [Winogradskyella sp.]|uniref:hypothetical protein n=1 Tax=Winogradskyella sp. TaxID=1883156 RepID=UPI001B1716D2
QTQNADWSAENHLVNINGTDVEIRSTLTKQGLTFTWAQEGYNTSDSNTFTVLTAAGNWDVQNQLGEINYTLLQDEMPATLKVTGTTESIVVQLTIIRPNQSDDLYSFEVETLTNL